VTAALVLGLGLLWRASKDARQQRAARRYGIAIGPWRICPACAEPIRVEATKCRYCQSDL